MTSLRIPIRKYQVSLKLSFMLILLSFLSALIVHQSLQTKSIVIQEVTQVLLEDEVLFTFENASDVQLALTSYMQSYLTQVDPNATVRSLKTVQDLHWVTLELENPDYDSIADFYTYLQQSQSSDQMITIQEGDSIWSLAESYEVSIEDIILLNPELNPDLIHPGDQIKLKAKDPLIDVQIILVNTVTESIPFETETLQEPSLYTNDRRIDQVGVEGRKDVTYEMVLINGIQNQIKVLSESITQSPIQQIVRVGTQVSLLGSGSGNYGVTTGTFQSSFGYRTHPITGVKTFHSGIDISNSLNTEVYAYASGTVVSTEWEGALGNTVTIDHGNGLVTKYGHLNEFSISVGELVSSGQLIAFMGKTGYVTGVHLHFEVLQDGVYQNPLNYLN